MRNISPSYEVPSIVEESMIGLNLTFMVKTFYLPDDFLIPTILED